MPLWDTPWPSCASALGILVSGPVEAKAVMNRADVERGNFAGWLARECSIRYLFVRPELLDTENVAMVHSHEQNNSHIVIMIGNSGMEVQSISKNEPQLSEEQESCSTVPADSERS